MLVGEHNDFANTENKLITKLISSLGGALIVRETVMTNNDFSSSDRSIAAHAITAGLHRWCFDKWASLAVDPKCEILMADTGRSGDVAMADFGLGEGSVTVWADINCMCADAAPLPHARAPRPLSAPPRR